MRHQRGQQLADTSEVKTLSFRVEQGKGRRRCFEVPPPRGQQWGHYCERDPTDGGILVSI